ncbi:putative integral membrane protein [Pullulanibacillus pueri]|uniref:Lipopolysaccharide assembly protein A domain-containing protein n=1 Tax=Pullulanibacillus pueri TaxID=1437324 RepID=A0A8J2ZXT1_9BACL|nr:lipopolysaccharide assembly LapA domain-containing protein [Pullulanibacillus pueri]MBM7683263.1 putative integral membrane protein [Pullulanibacillus pueri]GGH85771.1 hypothetical protein GCM10007096_31930 [Pullulanibacillus pueri]
MKGQWGFILALVFALLIAIFSVINVDPVTVNYLFGHAQWPLILVILGSVLVGGIIVGSVGIVRVFRLQRMVHRLTQQLQDIQESQSADNEKIAGEIEGPQSHVADLNIHEETHKKKDRTDR